MSRRKPAPHLMRGGNRFADKDNANERRRDVMNFDFTEEQKLLADSVRGFAQAHLAKGTLARAHNPRFPFEVAQLMSRQGLIDRKSTRLNSSHIPLSRM